VSWKKGLKPRVYVLLPRNDKPFALNVPENSKLSDWMMQVEVRVRVAQRKFVHSFLHVIICTEQVEIFTCLY
jgi:hypothetical protein